MWTLQQKQGLSEILIFYLNYFHRKKIKNLLLALPSLNQPQPFMDPDHIFNPYASNEKEKMPPPPNE